MTKNLILTSLFMIVSALGMHAITTAEVRFKDINADTTRINNVLEECLNANLSTDGQRIDFMAQKFIDTPYIGGTLEFEPEMLTVNTGELDCTTFVENILAMAMSVKEGRSSWRDFATHLKELRYRTGVVDGYASRLHYISDWVVDNTHNGLIEEVTARIVPAPDYRIKTLDFMTRNRSLYQALSDSAAFAQMKNVEMGYRQHRFPYIKARNLGVANLKTGDVIFFTTKTDGLDVSHCGFIHMADGIPYLLHASSKSQRVVLESTPLSIYFKRNPAVYGFRIVRLKDY